MEKHYLLLKRISKFLFNRIVYVVIAISLQLTWLGVQFYRLISHTGQINTALSIISLIVVLILINRDMNPSYKLLWTLLILAFPVFGLVFYLLVGKSRLTSTIDKHYNRIVKKGSSAIRERMLTRQLLTEADPLISRQSAYIRNATGLPVWRGTRVTYFKMGDDMFPVLLGELEKARHYIFIEFFIINYGVMWQSVLEILVRKAAQGVDVRIIYDDFGCMTCLPIRYYETLRANGIRCEVFNPFRLIANIIHNNRDHRKFCIIDGHTGFTGGINLSDEYINRKERFGTWKDTAILLQGDAVWNMTAMFLQMWNTVTRSEEEVPYRKYGPRVHQSFASPKEEGFVQPFGDSPLDTEPVGENVYLQILSQARRYVYICTPYLIVDYELMNALCLAARSGVDVRIMTPGIPDKKIVFMLTRSYYPKLVKAGVKIYQYQPGFLHAKSFVCDDKLAVCGTINLDYRSLYLHFEDGVWIYGNKSVLDIRDDFLATLQDCLLLTEEKCRSNLVVRGIQSILRVLAPFL